MNTPKNCYDYPRLVRELHLDDVRQVEARLARRVRDELIPVDALEAPGRPNQIERSLVHERRQVLSNAGPR